MLSENQIESRIEASVPSAGLYRSLKDAAEHEAKSEGVLTGLSYIDNHTKGLRPGKFNLVVGYSGHGKTTLMLTTGVANMSEDTPFLFVTADDTDDKILRDVLAMLYGMSTEEVEKEGPKWRSKRAEELEGQLLICSPQTSSSYTAEEVQWIYEEATEFWGKPPALACFDYITLLSSPLGSGPDARGNVITNARRLKNVARRCADSVWLFGHQCVKAAGSNCPALLTTHLEYGGHQEADGVILGCRRRLMAEADSMKDWELELEATNPTTNISVMKNKITGVISKNPAGEAHAIDTTSGIIREMTDAEKLARKLKGQPVTAGPVGGVKFSKPTLTVVHSGEKSK